MHNLPGRLVALDGRMGSGKTTLGRFLAWYFNVTLVETDFYLLGDGTLSRRTDEIARIVSARLDKDSPRPVIVEGIGVLQLLAELERSADSHVYVRNIRIDEAPDLLVAAYERQFNPRECADITVLVAHDG